MRHHGPEAGLGAVQQFGDILCGFIDLAEAVGFGVLVDRKLVGLPGFDPVLVGVIRIDDLVQIGIEHHAPADVLHLHHVQGIVECEHLVGVEVDRHRADAKQQVAVVFCGPKVELLDIGQAADAGPGDDFFRRQLFRTPLAIAVLTPEQLNFVEAFWPARGDFVVRGGNRELAAGRLLRAFGKFGPEQVDPPVVYNGQYMTPFDVQLHLFPCCPVRILFPAAIKVLVGNACRMGEYMIDILLFVVIAARDSEV